jgi:hypothetical protein
MGVIRNSNISILLSIMIGLEEEGITIGIQAILLYKEHEIIPDHFIWFLSRTGHEMGFNDLCNHPGKPIIMNNVTILVHELELVVGISMACFSLYSIIGIMSSSIRSSSIVWNKPGCINKYILPICTESSLKV